MADHQPSCLGGVEGEFILGPRQDNLVNAWAGLQALVKHTPKVSNSDNTSILCLYDHEEVKILFSVVYHRYLDLFFKTEKLKFQNV